VIEGIEKMKLLLFGGNKTILFVAKEAMKQDMDVVVFSDPFRLDTVINEAGTLRKNLQNQNICFVETDELSKELLQEHMTDDTVGLSVITFWIFKQDVIDLFHGRLYNYHGARLPFERGGGTHTWKILSGSKIGGLAVHKVEPGIDTGAIVQYREFMFPDYCHVPQDYISYIEGFIEEEFLLEFLYNINSMGLHLNPRTDNEQYNSFKQLEYHSMYFPLLNTKMNGFINWGWDVGDIELFINAFDNPYPGASTFCDYKRVYLKGCVRDSNNSFHPFQAGIVFRINEFGFFVACRGGSLLIRDVLDEKGDSVPVEVGSRFFTPNSYLELAMTSRARYGSKGLKK